MKIKTAIAQLQALAVKDPNALVSFKRLKPKKKRKLGQKGITKKLQDWAVAQCEKKGFFTFIDACRYYDRIGGSAGTSTVLHRLHDVGARNSSPGLAESHIRAKWVIGKHANAPIKELIAQDPTFAERYNQMRREAVEAGALAPPPLDEARFNRSWGKPGRHWVVVDDPDRNRQMRIEIKPQQYGN